MLRSMHSSSCVTHDDDDFISFPWPRVVPGRLCPAFFLFSRFSSARVAAYSLGHVTVTSAIQHPSSGRSRIISPYLGWLLAISGCRSRDVPVQSTTSTLVH